jgi:methionyl-tRNA formyltransferase
MRLVMMGTGTFAEPTLEALLAGPDPVVGVFTQPDREGVQKRGSTRQVGRGMKEIAAERGVPVFQPASVNAPDGVAMLRGLSPDLLVVAAYGQILSKEALSIPTQGAINVHGSLLPKYRGAAPVAWAILNGETETGVTIIRMSKGLDAGEMLAKAAIPIGDETAGELEAKLAPLGARLAVETIGHMKAGPVTGEKQDPALATKAPKLTKDMGLIDWTQPAERVCRQVRAMQPWPTAYTYLHRAGKEPLRVIVYRAQSRDETQLGRVIEERGTIIRHLIRALSKKPVGSVTVPPHGELWVGTGSGSTVQVLELQPAGKKRMAAEEFLRGHPVKDGDRFGPEVV